jgi:hypothetical protein
MPRLSSYRHPAAIRSTLTALARVVCPPDLSRLGLEDAVVDHVELMMRALPVPERAGLVSGLLAFELAAAAWPGHLGRRFARLDAVAAERYFRRWWASPLALQHELAKGVKGLLCLGFYEQPEVLAELGYTPAAWIDKVKTRRLAMYSDDIARHQAALIEADPLPGIAPAEPAPARARGGVQ